jgi:transcriptional regulator with XRE-family HTH domain
MTGINNSVLSRIETNERPVKVEELIKFAKVFDVTTDYLSGNKNGELSNASKEFIYSIDLSENEAVNKIRETFSYKGQELTEDQAKTIYYLSLGVLKKD